MGDMQLWPKNQVLAEKDILRVVCENCDQVWGIHKDMVGFRLACDCGCWIEVPWPAPSPEKALAEENKLVRKTDTLPVVPPKLDPEGLVKLSPLPVGEVRMEKLATNIPLAAGELEYANVATQASWTNRTILELVGILLAFWLPMLIVAWNWPADEWVQLLPLTSLMSSVLVVVVGHFASAYSFSGLRMPDETAFGEAVLGVVVAAFIAWLYVQGVQSAYPDVDTSMSPILEKLGVPLTLVVIALCPAVFEELAFRGLLQGRVSALMGRNQGILVTGVAFALAHGVTLAFPIHLGLGVYLCWLRARCGSLLPGMLFHGLYNASAVLLIG